MSEIPDLPFEIDYDTSVSFFTALRDAMVGKKRLIVSGKYRIVIEEDQSEADSAKRLQLLRNELIGINRKPGQKQIKKWKSLLNQYDEEELEKMVRFKHNEWKGTEMIKYFDVETFSRHIDKYISQSETYENQGPGKNGLNTIQSTGKGGFVRAQ